MTFRGSPHTAASALARAFDLLPRLDACCATRAHVTLRRLLMTSTTSIKTGVGVPPDSRVFGAYPELDHDTVAFYPSPIEELQKAPPASNPLAIQRYRELYFDIAAKRLTQFPKDADALEELGEAMELLAYPAAVDTIRRARSLAVEPHQLLRLAVSEGWLRLKAAVPHDLKEVAAVRLLADSLLTHARPTSGSDAALLATMAALVGDANRAAQLSESLDPKDDEREVPPDVLNNSRALLAYAGLGGPVDSIREREQRLANSIRNGVPPSKQAKMSSRLLRRPAVLAFPFYRLVSFQSLDTSNALVATEGAFMRGDRQSVRKLLHTAAQARAGLRPSDLTLDAIYPEAWLFAAIGDTASAMRTIAPAIDAIRAMPIRRFADVATVGALVRAMSLRAEILYYQGDREHGRQWARVVSALTDTSLVLARVTRARALEMALSKERH